MFLHALASATPTKDSHRQEDFAVKVIRREFFLLPVSSVALHDLYTILSAVLRKKSPLCALTKWSEEA